jgi:hypothetical protein
MLAERQGNLTKALGMAERALGLMSELDNSRDYARLRLEMAGQLLRHEPPRLERVADLLDRCAGDIEDLGSPLDKARWNVTTSELLLHQGDPSGAQARAQQALDLLARSPSSIDLAMMLVAVSDAQNAQGRSTDELLLRALQILGAAVPTRWTAPDFRALGERLAQEHPELAVQAFRMALDGAGVRDRSAALRRQVEALRSRPRLPAHQD